VWSSRDISALARAKPALSQAKSVSAWDKYFSIFHWTGTSGLPWTILHAPDHPLCPGPSFMPRTIPHVLDHPTCDINVTKCLGSFFKCMKIFCLLQLLKALNIIISLISLFILSLEYFPLPISTMVQGNIILAWQRSGTSIHIYEWPRISHSNIHNGLGQHHTSIAKV
jgi:hypothetical protein